MPHVAECMNEAVNSRSHSRAQLKKRWLSRLPGYAGFHKTLEDKRKGDARYSGILFNTSTNWRNGGARYSGTLFNTSTDKVKMEEKANCFTLLKRITGLKCVNSEIKSNVESCCLARHSPKGSYHLVEPAGRTHLYRKAIRIFDLECIEHAKQQRKWNPVKKLDQKAAVKYEKDMSSVLKWTEIRLAGSQLSRLL